jgi:O-antigen ligase
LASSDRTTARFTSRRSAIIETALIVACAGGLAAALATDLYTSTVIVLIAASVIGLLGLPLSWSVPTLVFLVPFRFYVSLPGSKFEFALTNFIIVGFAGACLAAGLAGERPRFRRWELLIIAWLTWTLVSLGWTSQPAGSLRGVFQWLMVFGSILISARCVIEATDPTRAARRILIALMALVGVWCIVGFVEVALGLDSIVGMLGTPAAAALFPLGLLDTKLGAFDFNWRSGNDVQPFGPFINAIEFGIFTAIGLGSAVALAVRRSALVPRWLVLSVFALAAAANVACLKATGWIAAGVAIAVAFVSLGRSLRRVIGISVATLAVIGGVLFAFREALIQRVQDLAAREGQTGATAEALTRPAIWLGYLDVARTQPLTGLGLGAAISYGPVHWTRLRGGDAVAVQLPTENGYLTVLVESGVVGLGLLTATLVGAAVIGLKLSRRFPNDPLAEAGGIAAIGIAAILAGNMTVDAFIGDINGVLEGVLVGIVIAANRLVPLARRIP